LAVLSVHGIQVFSLWFCYFWASAFIFTAALRNNLADFYEEKLLFKVKYAIFIGYYFKNIKKWPKIISFIKF